MLSVFKRQPHRAGTLVSDTSDDRHGGARDGFINSCAFPTRMRACVRALAHAALVNKYAPSESTRAYYSPDRSGESIMEFI